MDVLRQKIKYMLFLLTGVVIGYIVGVLSITILVSYRIDKYHQEITYLNNVIEDKDVKLKKLEEVINDRKFIVKDIEIILVYDGDDIDKLKLQKYIKEKYNMLLGKEVKTIDTDLVSEIIDKRIMKIDEKEYKLSLEKLILSEIVKLWIKIDQI
ncbi:hypothetical protein SAMN05661008_00871 [Alkalithermobacter thermoalcaliphilus JW-YL-7 = DSM 7308]|uniref:Sporulation membrane protein YtrI C-terminal domain-containing protein n=1 Tax=Alkalithermobacter thermoalcaliphilus JW-YL-7 = DSM 7308 TaxID=1121328 RepID=A0A150FQK8_CLOPD|nr:hypothetical protein JWYL7_0982 [[Clostridium] paradoxum JW-YL-7 = DSM 7308]SHK77885.1 hypothetical protein SAMN05661008_00871 [[Clostridium] paradoxum JW-YL-7 = DSM 7308]